jgi:hypothetical protein
LRIPGPSVGHLSPTISSNNVLYRFFFYDNAVICTNIMIKNYPCEMITIYYKPNKASNYDVLHHFQSFFSFHVNSIYMDSDMLEYYLYRLLIFSPHSMCHLTNISIYQYNSTQKKSVLVLINN